MKSLRATESAIGGWRPASDATVHVLSPGIATKPLWGGAGPYIERPRTTVLARQDALADEPGLRYITWFFHEEDGGARIAPGESLSGFGVDSDYLPGLTTAWFSSGKLVEFDQDWPREIFADLVLLEHPRWRMAPVTTVGPMYPPSTPRDQIAKRLLLNVEQLTKAGLLKPSSPFVAQTLRTLSEHGSQASPSMTSAASGALEEAISTVMEISLAIVGAHPR
jgi:hypothetical protein